MSGGDTTGDTFEAEAPFEAADLLGTVAIVGFPNVGKSTLINRLTSTRAAVVHETSGTTRDRKELVCEWAGKRFLLIDTGGVDIASSDAVARSIVEQARLAISESDLVLLVADARAGVTPGDEELAEILRLSHKPVLVLANKIDDPAQEPLALELHRLGLGDPLRSRGCTATTRATCSTRSSRAWRTSGRHGRPSGTRRSASRSSGVPTSASRRSSTR